MGNQVPGPMCTSRVGDKWIDQGTMCLAKSPLPGPCASLVRAKCSTMPFPGSGDKSAFDGNHVYSQAKEAATKRAIDLQIIGGDYSRTGEISLENEDYLKKLIELGSRRTQKVSDQAASGMQFFIIQGGGEGLLPHAYENKNAGRVPASGQGTNGKSNQRIYDVNDVIAVFDSGGHLVSAARLIRPLNVPGELREKTAEKVYNSWHKKNVSIYRNTYFYDLGGIMYLGLSVDDGFRGSGKGSVTIDLHKKEDTNGCIFIADRHTPRKDELDADGKRLLNSWEPRLIVDILKAKGMAPEDVKKHHQYHLGIVYTVKIQ
jgi:hypothetical protein